MLKYLIAAAFSILFLSSCSKGHGNLLQSEKLDVYYEFQEDEKLASSLGHFWKSKGLLGSSKQSIRLTKDDEYYFVQLISSDPKNVENIPFQEMKLLMDLQNELDTTVFKEAGSVQIILCNNEFKPLHNINH
jgi:hypothetical protein